MFLLMALMHGVVVWWVSLFFPTKKAVLKTAAVMAAIGGLTGSPIYMGLDLLGVALFTVICFKQINARQAKTEAELPERVKWLKTLQAKEEAEAGQGFGWDDRDEVMDAKIAASKAKREALKLKFAAEREAAAKGSGNETG